MNVSRRGALAAGISYGSGCLNFGNDSIVYNRELLKLPKNEAYAQLRAAIEAGDLEAAKAAAETLRDLCSKLALSEAYVEMKPVLEALSEDALPAIDELEQFDTAFGKALAFVEGLQ